jgi:hypothetical protein
MDYDRYIKDELTRCVFAFAFSMIIAGILGGGFIDKLRQFNLGQNIQKKRRG